ncbi:aldo/keto reductase [Streptomyces albidoflavus]|uniref:aldo/keto reductase n=1 Tax=Streptomyces albidoflavus TaxID=1886 RepID=UPI00101E83CA|nr:aldo/keto reductase [Streptomyces albidoflavus]RZD90944.1 oxidoreductase [Streptomyces albidoflavus]
MIETILLGGDLRVRRLGLGTMRLPGPGVWGPPTDRAEAVRVLRTAVDLGVNFLDTADSYGPAVAEELIREALHPYPDDLVIATKAGLLRPEPIVSPGPWPRCGRPEYLRQQAELSLRRLRVERLDLFQLHRVDETVPFEDQIGALAQLRDEGKVRHVGLSGVDLRQLRAAERIVPVVSVQNRFNLLHRSGTDVLKHAERHQLAFLPFAPLAQGGWGSAAAPLEQIAHDHATTVSQVALAWLLHRSAAILPIPGTSKVRHLRENIEAAQVSLPAEVIEQLETL